VLPAKLPLDRFYRELVRTQQILNRTHLGFAALKDTFVMATKFLAAGQTNFVKMLWKFSSVYNAERQSADHRRDTHYSIGLPPMTAQTRVDLGLLYIHKPAVAAAGRNAN
jgi:hypothetical protein